DRQPRQCRDIQYGGGRFQATEYRSSRRFDRPQSRCRHDRASAWTDSAEWGVRLDERIVENFGTEEKFLVQNFSSLRNSQCTFYWTTGTIVMVTGVKLASNCSATTDIVAVGLVMFRVPEN